MKPKNTTPLFMAWIMMAMLSLPCTSRSACRSPEGRPINPEDVAGTRGQIGNLTLSLVVFSPTAKPVECAVIHLLSVHSSTFTDGMTDAYGYAKLTGLPSGDYILKVYKKGFRTTQQTLTLGENSPGEVRITMSPKP
jgi:hypothetical protein